MSMCSFPETRQIRLGLPGLYQDVTFDLKPLTIYVSNIHKSATCADVASALEVPESCVSFKEPIHKDKSNAAFLQPSTWTKSDFILGEGQQYTSKLKGKNLAIKQAFDEDKSVPSYKSYKIHKLSEEDFDLTPACSEKPSIHCLNDDVLIHILGYLNLKEKLHIEAVCRRWQALIYRLVGRQNTVDLNADDCLWGSVIFYSVIPGGLQDDLYYQEDKLQKCKSVMYKMLILNESHLTTLHLDEHRCFIDVNIVSAIGRLATNLEVLSLRFSKNRSHYTSLRAIFSNCSKLKTVCLDAIKSTKSLFSELRCCKSLEVLRLSCVEELYMKGKLALPLKELSFSDVLNFKLNLKAILQPNLRTFRLFRTLDVKYYYGVSNFGKEMAHTLPKICPDLVELQVTCYDVLSSLQSFKNLKILHIQLHDLETMQAQLKANLPAIEDLRMEFSFSAVTEEFYDKATTHSFDFSEHVPSSVKSLTLPTLAFDDASYKSLLALPNLERIFFKSRSFSAALLEKFVLRTQIVEIGAGMLKMTHHAVKALASVRRKALAKATKNAATHDSAQPLVLHLPRLTDGEGKFQDPLLKIIELRGEGYLYHRVGWTRFDSEWVDFGLDFLQHDLGRPYYDEDFSDHSGGDFSDDLSYGSDRSSYLAERFWAVDDFFDNEFDDDDDDDDPDIYNFYG